MFETDTPYAYFRAESTNKLIFHMLMCCVYDCVLSLYIYDVENYYSIQLISYYFVQHSLLSKEANPPKKYIYFSICIMNGFLITKLPKNFCGYIIATSPQPRGGIQRVVYFQLYELRLKA